MEDILPSKGDTWGVPGPTFLMIFLVAAGLIVLMLASTVPKRTRAARTALRRLRRTYRHLGPGHAPAYATYGAAGTVMGIAIFGRSRSGHSTRSSRPGRASNARSARRSPPDPASTAMPTPTTTEAVAGAGTVVVAGTVAAAEAEGVADDS